ncbi:MAG: copper chaperone PCu(A)C [Candidatus Latescibacterota bacterium]
MERACWFLFLLLATCSEEQTSSLVVREAWVREPPGGHPIAAAYFLLENPTDEALVLVGAESPVVERVEIHLMSHKDGKMRMRQIQSLQIPAKGNLVLQPSGLHLMLIGMEQAPKAGESIELTLRFADGQNKKVLAAVRRGSYAD